MNKTTSVIRQIADLQRMSHAELKGYWRALNGAEAPPHNRAFLVKRLAYRVQELAYGGLSERAKTKLREVFESSGYDAIGGYKGSARKARIRREEAMVTGTKLRREWNGRLYEVTAIDSGFEFEGRRYRSLSAVATAITGTHCNGRAFFGLDGLNGKRKRSCQ